MRRNPICLLALSLALSTTIAAQTPATTPTPQGGEDTNSAPPASDATPPQAPAHRPTQPPVYHASPNESYLTHVGAFCGAGASTSSAGSKPTAGCGAGFTFVPLPIFVEVGVMGPQANRSYLSAYISVDGSIPLAPQKSKYLPMALIGYSRLFETGHALDYGLALAMPHFKKRKNDTGSIRIELRDYCTFANPTQHNVMLRIGWMGQESD